MLSALLDVFVLLLVLVAAIGIELAVQLLSTLRQIKNIVLSFLE